MEEVIKTKKGIFIRTHIDFGAIVFSPYSGLFFAIKEEFVLDTIQYCQEKKIELNDEIRRHLEIGLGKEKEVFPVKHYLPNSEQFHKDNVFPPFPIVINWLISNKCNCKCNYCYADDVIDHYFDEVPVDHTVKKILDLNPLAVVISGGEPFMVKEKLKKAIELLGGKVGLMIDTNGLLWDDEIVALMKKYNVVARISVDNIIQKDNSKTRVARDRKINAVALQIINENILKYVSCKVPVLIHTVVTSYNKKSLSSMAKGLPAMGVNGWRLFSVIRPNNKSKDIFNKVLNYRNDYGYEDQLKDIKSELDNLKSKFPSKSDFSIEIIPTTENSKNSVVMVLPDGKLVTESLFEKQKMEIPEDAIFANVTPWGHYERYLGKI